MLDLKNIRYANHVTQQDIADALGVSRSAYSNYESGRYQPDIDTLVKFADYFGVSIDEVLGRKPRPTEAPAQPVPDTPRQLVPQQLVAAYSFLNDTGRKLLTDYANMLTQNPELVTFSSRDKAAQ